MWKSRSVKSATSGITGSVTLEELRGLEANLRRAGPGDLVIAVGVAEARLVMSSLIEILQSLQGQNGKLQDLLVNQSKLESRLDKLSGTEPIETPLPDVRSTTPTCGGTESVSSDVAIGTSEARAHKFEARDYHNWGLLRIMLVSISQHPNDDIEAKVKQAIDLLDRLVE